MIQRIQTIYLLFSSLIGIGVIFLFHQKEPSSLNFVYASASILNLVIIFLYKFRELQIRLILVPSILFLGATSILILNSAFLPLIPTILSLGLNILSYRSIKHDIQLLKNSDRLR
jgi:hypothetical protein